MKRSQLLLAAKKAEKITTPISNYTTPWFEYHADDGLYYRFQYGGEQTDGNTGDQLKYENVLIQFAHYTSIDDHDRQQLDLVGEGTGLYASNGVIVPVTWKNHLKMRSQSIIQRMAMN